MAITANLASLENSTYDRITSYRIAAGAVCISVVLVALMIGHFHQIGTFTVETDFYQSYVPQAKNILQGRPYTYVTNPPGYVLLLAAGSFLTSDFFILGKIMSAVALGLLGWISYLLLDTLFDSRIAFTATTLFLVSMIPHSFLAATDIVWTFVMMLSVWVLLRSPSLTLVNCVLAGILAGVAYLIRYNAIPIILIIACSLVFLRENHEGLSRRLLRAVFFCFATLLTISPWLLINWQQNGNPFASVGHLAAATKYYQPEFIHLEPAMQRYPAEFASFTEVILYDPARFVSKYIQSAFYDIELLAFRGLPYPAFLFAGAGFLLLLNDLCKKRLVFLLVCLAEYLFLCLVAFHLRYYYFLFPLLFVLVTYFLFNEHIYARLGRISYLRIPVSWSVMIILAAFLARNAVDESRQVIASEPRYLIEIADFLKSRSSGEDIMIVRKPHLAYLAGLRGAFHLEATADGYLAKARATGARYIVYSDFEASLWPGLDSLKDPGALPEDFKLIYQLVKPRVLVYEIDRLS